MLGVFRWFGHFGEMDLIPLGGGGGVTFDYVAENGTTFYVAEDGVTNYIQE